MLLKRIYKPGTEPPELDYISLGNTGTTPNQNFSIKLVTDMMEQGLMEIKADKLTLHVYPEDLHYTILRSPGRYCAFCGEKLQDDASGQLARLHVAMEHAGETSTEHPAGYEAINHFECVLDADQHEKYRIKEVARATTFPRKDE